MRFIISRARSFSFSLLPFVSDHSVIFAYCSCYDGFEPFVLLSAMKYYLIPALLLFLLIGGCAKDKFPDEFTLIGKWLEQTEAADKIEVEFKVRNRAYLRLSADRPLDTLNYRLDKQDELKLFLPEDYPNGKYTLHRITYSQKKKELIIYNLLPSIPENPSRSVFKRR